jgi:hypothetical protein
MTTISGKILHKETLISILTDLGALTFIYLVPTISHLISLPVYLIEPMRLMLILALVHTNKKNAYLLAITLPLFSLIISGHPVLPKMILIAMELSLNVFLFYALSKRMKQIFPAILLSIIFSKAIYYILKFSLIQLTVINGDLFTTPILVQAITTLVFSGYLVVFYKKNQTQKPD